MSKNNGYNINKSEYPYINNIKEKLPIDRPTSNNTIKNNSEIFEKNNKWGNIEKLVNILYDENNRMENRLTNEIRKLQKQFFNEKEIRIKLEGNLKNSEDLYNQLSNEYLTRINSLESKSINLESKNSKLNERAIHQDQVMRELSAFIQNLNNIDRNEIIELKSIIKDKITEDQQMFAKEKEKSKALFTEVVRIGENQDKYVSNLQNNRIEIESRMQSIEQKLILNEKSILEELKKADSGKEIYEKWNERFEERLKELENGLVTIGVF